MESENDRLRVVVMGDRRVGKTSLIRQFLYTTFQEKYKPTIEDLYSENFNVGDSKLKVDILDTAGDDEFPVMRRLSINSGHAFLLVYSVDDPVSLELIQTRLEEIQQQRVDFKEIPIVIAGNKVDLGCHARQIFVEDVIDWTVYTVPTNRIRVVECSAKDTYNVNNVFKTFLELSNIPIAKNNLRRGASAYAKLRHGAQGESSLHKRIKSLKLPGRMNSDRQQRSSTGNNSPSPESTSASPPGSLSHSPNSMSPTPNTVPASPSPVFDFNCSKLMRKNTDRSATPIDEEKTRPESDRKQRSRSLIRRSSNKIRRKVNEPKPEECVIS